ncbi:hypothetical protein B6U96_16160 [Archaeoglobales archaeon ex4484_92]|nr:MAG: hypothetical protein B6U96_16160 [Archaeoglobales archaeon ex4484_92]
MQGGCQSIPWGINSPSILERSEIHSRVVWSQSLKTTEVYIHITMKFEKNKKSARYMVKGEKMDEFVYTTKIKDSMNFVYPSKTEQNVKFVYTKFK